MYGITYRGRHSREFGVIVQTRTRPACPPVRTAEETAPYRDGALDYSRQGGRLFYDDKIMELDLIIPRSELRLTHRAVSKLVGWLSGWYGELIFDDMPLVIWEARPIDLSDVSVELYRVGKVTVQFRCRPFNRLMFQSTGVPLDSGLPLDSDVILDYGADSVFQLESGEQTVTYHYDGDAETSPVFRVAGSGLGRLALTLGGRTLTFNHGFTELEIDCGNWRTKSGGNDVTDQMAGDYPELSPGDNEITVDIDGPGTLTVECWPMYMYGDTGLDE